MGRGKKIVVTVTAALLLIAFLMPSLFQLTISVNSQPELLTSDGRGVEDWISDGMPVEEIRDIYDHFGVNPRRGSRGVGQTLLHVAAEAGRADVAEWLIRDHRLDVDKQVPEPWVDAGDTPLHKAAEAGHADVVRVLLASGADARIEDRWGRTPADLAQREGHEAIARLLKRYNQKLWMSS